MSSLVLKKLRTPRGATLPMLMEETGWQAHSVPGFLSGTVRKRLEAILAGHQPADLSVQTLTRRINLPVDWTAQAKLLGF